VANQIKLSGTMDENGALENGTGGLVGWLIGWLPT
jgi:hypothetical protein